MAKVGALFRDARLEKGLTLDQVADETNISKRFLQGIENDNFQGFPGSLYPWFHEELCRIPWS